MLDEPLIDRTDIRVIVPCCGRGLDGFVLLETGHKIAQVSELEGHEVTPLGEYGGEMVRREIGERGPVT